MKLGTLLLRDGIINLDQLEAALRAQVLFGGKLGTNLVELGHLSLDTLAIYLGKTLAVAPATQERFENADPEAVRLLPAALAQKHVAFPLGFEGPPRRLAVALADPRDRAAVATLAEACGLPIEPYIAPELRIVFYLERHYGVPRKVRFVRVAPATAERRRDATPAPAAVAVGSGPAPAPAAPALPPLPLGEALGLIEHAKNREAIGEAILRFARGRVETAVVFVLKEGLAIGWRGFAPGVEAASIESLSLPLGAPSCLAAAYEGRAPWRGAPTAAGRPLDERLFSGLRVTEPPDEVLTMAVLIGTRVVNLVYVHGHQGGALEDGAVDGLLALVDAAGEAYARMIQAAKTKATE